MQYTGKQSTKSGTQCTQHENKSNVEKMLLAEQLTATRHRKKNSQKIRIKAILCSTTWPGSRQLPDNITLSGLCWVQWRQLHRAWRHREHQNSKQKLTKLYWPGRKCTPKRLIVVLEQKKWHDQKKVPQLSNSFRRHWLGVPGIR